MRSNAETTRIEGRKRPTAFCCIDCYCFPIHVGHGFLAHTIRQSHSFIHSLSSADLKYSRSQSVKDIPACTVTKLKSSGSSVSLKLINLICKKSYFTLYPEYTREAERQFIIKGEALTYLPPFIFNLIHILSIVLICFISNVRNLQKSNKPDVYFCNEKLPLFELS